MNGQNHSTFLLSINDTIIPINTTINGKYAIIRGLGKGGFSETYLVREFNQEEYVDDSQYVLKLLKTDNENERQMVQKHFEREAQILNDLGNKNQNKNIAIPTIKDNFEWQLERINQNTYCIVETYFEGISLDLKMDENDLFSEEEVKNFLEQILNILDFLHDKSKNNIDIFTHRDVSPNNIICQADGTYALIDFGTIISEKYKDFARNLHSVIERNEKTRIGTRGYAHIEQEYGMVDNLPSLDIYSLGRIAVQMLTGESPKLLHPNNYDPRLDNIPNITDEFVEFLIKMTYYEHDKRFQSAGEALKDLKKIPTDIIPQEYKPFDIEHVKRVIISLFAFIVIIPTLIFIYNRPENPDPNGTNPPNNPVGQNTEKCENKVNNVIETQIVPALKETIGKESYINDIEQWYKNEKNTLNEECRQKFYELYNPLIRDYVNFSINTLRDYKKATEYMCYMSEDYKELDNFKQKLSGWSKQKDSNIIEPNDREEINKLIQKAKSKEISCPVALIDD